MKDECSLQQHDLLWFELCQPFIAAWLFCGIEQKQSPRCAACVEFVLSKVGMGTSSSLTVILFVTKHHDPSSLEVKNHPTLG